MNVCGHQRGKVQLVLMIVHPLHNFSRSCQEPTGNTGKVEVSSIPVSVCPGKTAGVTKVFCSFMEVICSSSEHAEHAAPFPSERRQHNFPQLFTSEKKRKVVIVASEDHHTPAPNPDSILFFCLSLRSLSFTPLKLLKVTCSRKNCEH